MANSMDIARRLNTPGLIDLVKFTQGLKDPQTGLGATADAATAALIKAEQDWIKYGGEGPSSGIVTSKTGVLTPDQEAEVARYADAARANRAPGVDWAHMQIGGGGALNPEPNVATDTPAYSPEEQAAIDKHLAKIAAMNAAKQGIKNTAYEMAEKQNMDRAKASAEAGKPFVVTNESGDHAFETQGQMDAYVANKEKADADKAKRLDYSNKLAQFKARQRDAAKVSQMYGGDAYGANGQIDPQFAAAHPEAARILVQAKALENETALAREELGIKDRALTVNQETEKYKADAQGKISGDANKTAKEIAMINNDGEIVRAKVNSDTAIKVGEGANETTKTVAEITSNAAKYTDDTKKAVMLMQIKSDEVKHDAEIKLAGKKQKFDAKEFASNDKYRWATLNSAEAEAEKNRKQALAMGMSEIEAQKYAVDSTEKMYGQQIASLAADRDAKVGIADKELAFKKYATEEDMLQRKQNANLIANSQAEDRKLQLQLSDAKRGHDMALFNAEREHAKEMARAAADPSSPANKERLAASEASINLAKAQVQEIESKIAMQKQQVTEAATNNKDLEERALSEKYAREMHLDIPDSLDRVRAFENSFSSPEFLAKLRSHKGKGQHPAVNAYIDALRKTMDEDRGVVDTDFAKGGDTELRMHANWFLKKLTGDDSLALELTGLDPLLKDEAP